MILGLSTAKVVGAIFVAICISFAFTFMTIPSPVETQKQAITPVPTPPPVIITTEPTLTSSSVTTIDEDALVAAMTPAGILGSVYNSVSLAIMVLAGFLYITNRSASISIVLVGIISGLCFWLGWISIMAFVVVTGSTVMLYCMHSVSAGNGGYDL